VRARLARAEAAIAAASEMPPERVRALLAERARALARPLETGEVGEVRSVLTFALGTGRYAIETRYVREVLRLVDVTPVPGASELVSGVTNLRGDVLCLVNLRRLLDLPVEHHVDLSWMIVVGSEVAEFGLPVGELFEIVRLRHEDVVTAPETLSASCRRYLLGIARDALIVIDGAALVGDPRLYVNQQG
jgi:purine-binding chemotaxis protein CheW